MLFRSSGTAKRYAYCTTCRPIVRRAQGQNLKVQELREAMLAGTLDALVPRKRKHYKTSINAGAHTPDAAKVKPERPPKPTLNMLDTRGLHLPTSGAELLLTGNPSQLCTSPPALMTQSVLVSSSSQLLSHLSSFHPLTAPPVCAPAKVPSLEMQLSGSFVAAGVYGAQETKSVVESAGKDMRRSTLPTHTLSLSIAGASHPAMFGFSRPSLEHVPNAELADKSCAMCGLSYCMDFFKRSACGKLGYCMMCERLRSRANNKRVLVSALREAMANGMLEQLLVSRGVEWNAQAEFAAIATFMMLEDERAHEHERRRVTLLSQPKCASCGQVCAPGMMMSAIAADCKRCVIMKERGAVAGLSSVAVAAALAAGTCDQLLRVCGSQKTNSSAPAAQQPVADDGSRKTKRNRRCGFCDYSLPLSEFRVTSRGVAEWCNQCSDLCERGRAMDLTPDEVRSAMLSGSIEFLLPPI